MKHGYHDRIIFSDIENLEGFGSSSPEQDNLTMKQEWRRYGAARRKELIEKDEQEGGTRFELHKKCHIEQYFSIADRVRKQNTLPKFLGKLPILTVEACAMFCLLGTEGL